MSHEVRWYSPAPLWAKRLENGSPNRLRTPALLRFGTDDFMTRFRSVLEKGGTAFVDAQAGDESRNGTGDGTPTASIPLYQPAHERYYLVTASLVCRERGLPDRAVDTANQEQVGFLLRRLEPDPGGPTEIDGQQYAEYRWVTSGDEEGQGAWHPVAHRRQIGTQEERLSMFPQTYEPTTPQERMKGDRRLWAGLIPVAKRETYETAPVRSANGDDTAPPVPNDPNADPNYALDDPRKTTFETRVIQAFKGIRDQLDESPGAVSASEVRDPLVFAWLDLWQFLDAHLSGVASAIKDATGTAGLGDPQTKIFNRLQAADATDVLRAVAEHEPDLEGGDLDAVSLPHFSRGGEAFNRSELKGALNTLLEKEYQGDTRPELQKYTYQALDELKSSDSLPEDLRPPSTEPVDGGLYVVRCVYERPQCPPPRRTTVSGPSRPFRLASFFDAEAPPRDINITLPGASVQDFRDSDQSVTMRFTKELRKQAQRIQDVTMSELENGKIGAAPNVNIGMICSLSIPIITICALILLLIMVVALNIVFWWLPFFKICFPLPSSD